MVPPTPRRLPRHGQDAWGDALARICRLYGVRPVLGRTYGALFTSLEPLGLDQLCAQVGTARSTMSVVLRQLLALRLVERLPSRSDRRDYYQVVADPWAVFADWNRLYFQPELEIWQRASGELAGTLQRLDPAAREVLTDRLENLTGFVDSIAGVLRGLGPAGPSTTAPARSIPITLGDGA